MQISRKVWQMCHELWMADSVVGYLVNRPGSIFGIVGKGMSTPVPVKD